MQETDCFTSMKAKICKMSKSLPYTGKVLIFTMHVVVSLQNYMKNSQKLIQNIFDESSAKNVYKLAETCGQAKEYEEQEIDITQSDEQNTNFYFCAALIC